MSKDKTAGQISLPGIFSAAAQELLTSIQRGRILHKTHNIRDAGAPLEASFRELFAALLPSGFLVRHGFLYDTTSNCTPQLDIIIAAADRSQVMLKAPDGATYSAVTDAYAVGEIKSSADALKKHLTQFAVQVGQIQDMRRTVTEWSLFSAPELIGFMVIGDSSKLRHVDLAHHWAMHPDGKPSYILLLDKGLIVTPYSIDLAEIGMVGDATPVMRPTGPDVAIWSADGEEADRPGLALLWLYYAIIHQLRHSQAHEFGMALRELENLSEIELGVSERIAAQLSNTADPFAAAMVRGFNLVLVKAFEAQAAKPRKPRKPQPSATP